MPKLQSFGAKTVDPMPLSRVAAPQRGSITHQMPAPFPGLSWHVLFTFYVYEEIFKFTSIRINQVPVSAAISVTRFLEIFMFGHFLIEHSFKVHLHWHDFAGDFALSLHI
jgi:hypothetical protein